MAEDDDFRAAFAPPPVSSASQPPDDLAAAFAGGSSAPPTDIREQARERGRSQGSGGILSRIAAPFMATGQAMGNAMYGNLMDYPVAAAHGVVGAVRGQGFGPSYRGALEDIRGYREGLLENRPIERIGGSLVGAVPAALVGSRAVTAAEALPGLGRGLWNNVGSIGQSGLVGAATSAAQGAAEGEGLQDRLQRAGTGALVGGIAGAGAESVIRGGAATLGRATGRTVPEAAPGYDPSLRALTMQNEGFTPTMGQITGNLQQQQFEQRALHGAYGPRAQQILENAQAAQNAQRTARQTELLEEIGGGPQLPRGSPGAPSIQSDVRQVAQNYRTLANQGYERVQQSPAGFTIDGVRSLNDIPTAVFDKFAVTRDPAAIQRLPSSDAARSHIARVVAAAEDNFAQLPPSSRPGVAGGNQVAYPGQPATPTIPFAKINELRQAINDPKMVGTPERGSRDEAVLTELRRSFSNWLEGAPQNPHFRGTDQVVRDLQQANQDWRRYREITYGNSRAPDADARNIISDLVRRDRTPEEITARVAGATGAGTAGRSSRVVPELERILGHDNAGLGQLRSSFVENALYPPTRGAPALPGPQRQISGLDYILDRGGRPVAQELLTPAERSAVAQHRTALGMLPPRPEAMNPSKTEWQRLASRAETAPWLALGLGGLGAFGTGTAGGAALGLLPYLRQMSGTARANAAVRPNMRPMDLGTARLLGLLGTQEVSGLARDLYRD